MPTSEGQRGSVTAEFALVLPSVLLVGSLLLAAVLLCGEQIRVIDAAGMAARAAGRGESPVETLVVLDGLEAVRASTSDRGALVCVEVSATARKAGLAIPLGARACAAADGR